MTAFETKDVRIIPHKHNAFNRFLFSQPIQPVPEVREHNIQDTSWKSRILWCWVFRMLRRGYDRVIVPEDITYVPEKDAMKHRYGDYKRYLNVHKPTTKTHFREMWALLFAMRWKLLFALVLKIISSACQLGMSLITRRLIEEAEAITEVNGNASHGPVTGFTIGMCVLDIIMLVADAGSLYYSIMNSEFARTLMMACIHDKMLRLGPQQRYDFSAGKILTLSSSDCRRASSAFIELNSVLVLPIYFGATIGILVYMVGVSGLPGVGLLFLGLILCAVLSYYVAVLRISSMPYQDRRISLTRETLKNITIIKFYAWEQSFLKLVTKLRAVETTYIRLIEFVDALNVAAAIAIPNLAGALSFAVKIILTSNLEPSRAFPSLTLFQMFMPIFSQSSFAFITFADAAVACQRLNTFFRLPEVPNYIESLPDSPSTRNLTARIVNGRLSWFIGGEDDSNEDLTEDDGGEFKNIPDERDRTEKIVLDDVNIDLPRSSMTLVIGAVGSGKTSLLSAFINTIPKASGAIQIAPNVKVSSVLSLWSLNASIRENILFGLEYNPKKYRKVLKMCDLESDFALFSHGDRTDVGENGVTLSGGQRARLALARCLYADGDLMILDDVLSAMDSRVGNHVYRELLKLAHLEGKTILFSTNNLKYIRDADYLISLDGKGSAVMGSAKDSYSATYLHTEASGNQKETPGVSSEHEILEHKKENELQEAKSRVFMPTHIASDAIVGMSNPGPIMPNMNETIVTSESSEKCSLVYKNQDQGWDTEKDGGIIVSQMDTENRAVGSVNINVLIRYFRLNTVWGFSMFFGTVFSLMCFACSESMVNVVLNWWTSDKFHKPQGFDLGIYCLVVALVGIFYGLFSNFLSFTSTHSSTYLHNLALNGMYRAPTYFFQANPLGRIMMRFTEDMVNLDTRLLAFARMAFLTMFSLVSAIIVIFVYVPWSIVCLVPILLMSFVLMAFYRTTSRELNRCQQLFDSRGMTSVSEHIEGQEVIVAFSRVNESQQRLNNRLDDVISATLHNEAANFWMATRSGMLCEIINLVTIFLAVFQVFNLNPSEVGMLISILPNVRNNLFLLFPMYALFDNQLNSVERLDEYATSVPVEGDTMLEKTRNDQADWNPSGGEIQFKSVSLRYRKDLPFVLDGLSITIGAGEKVGICGRTGAGKSTIISALFRLVELSSGTITIDGQDISELPLSTLRRALSIIPQQPVLFQGSIRTNLDPFEECSDVVLNKALAQSGLSVDADDGKFSLNSDVQAEGANFSLGERQMLALARAIVRGSTILVLDEATAAVDQGTDERIQHTIKSVFDDRTIICIAHRLETILDYDKIIVMGAGGKLLEVGSPKELWDRGEVFHSMCNEASVSVE